MLSGMYGHMNDEKTERFEIRVPSGFGQRLDELRKLEPDLPSRSEMMRRLVERAHYARKDLSELMGQVEMTDTPFLSKIGRSKRK